MAKRIKNPIVTRIVEDDEAVTAIIEYGVECDDGLDGRRGHEPELTPAEQTMIEQVAAKSKEKAEAVEGI